MKPWYSYRKPKQTVFRISEFTKQVNSERFIRENEIDEWRNIVDGDEEKLWNHIKRILKVGTQLRQESNWNNGTVGKILKQFKRNY